MHRLTQLHVSSVQHVAVGLKERNPTSRRASATDPQVLTAPPPGPALTDESTRECSGLLGPSVTDRCWFIPQEWSRSQNSISSLLSELEELETALKRPGSGPRCEEENRLQVIQTHTANNNVLLLASLLFSYLRATTALRSGPLITTLVPQQTRIIHRSNHASTPIPPEPPPSFI